MGTSAVTFDPATIKPIEGAETVPSITPQAQALAGAVSFATQQSPDHWAKLLKFQQVTGIPPVVSKGNEEMVKQAVDAQSIDPHYLTTIAPNVSNWASNPDNAAVSGVDEIHRLSGIEQNAFVMRAHTPSWIETSNDYIRRGVQALTGKTTDQMQADLYQNPLTRGAIDIVGGTAGMIGNIGSMFGIHGSDGKKNLLQRVEEGLSPEENTDPASLFHKSNEFDWLAKNVAPMIPAMLVSGGTAGLASAMKISPTAAKVLSGLAVGGAFTADQGGKTYTQVKESGGSDYQARLSANRVAAINAIPNALFGATDVVSFLRDNPMLTSFGIGGLTGASGQISQNVVTGKSTFEGVGAAALQGAAIQGGMHLGTEAFFGNLSQAVDAAATSKLRERSPEKFQEALSQVFQGDESLRIPADQFAEYFKAQGQKPSEVAASIGASNYAEALLSGGDVEIPKADFLGKLDPDHQKALLPDVVDPSTGVTARQTQQGRDELQQWVSGGGPETMVADAAQADAETAMSPEVQSLKTDIQQRYEAAGESPEVAATLAEKDANVYANIAKSANLKPSELLAMYDPKVSVSEAIPEGSLAQAGTDSPRGWFKVNPDGSYEIGRTKIGDFSTFSHESAHAYLHVLGDLAGKEGASDTLKADHTKILDWLGAKAGEELSVDQQEKWARANELYLREGKAPSSSLRGAFQRFGVWLQSVYRKASDLGVELSDDIRGVLDRLYAAETGVDRAASEAGPRMFTSAEEAGWTEDQFKTYADANDVSVEQAKEFILAKLNEARVRDSSDAWREEEKNVRAAVTAEIDHKPEYAAIRQLRKGKMDDGTDLTINKEAFVKQFGEERAKALQKQHPGMYRAEGGVEPEVAAEMLGFSSGEAMVKGIEDSPRRSVAIEDSTRAYMTAKHGDIRYDGSLRDKADIALMNDKRAENLHRELQALKRRNNPEAELSQARREVREQARLDKLNGKIADLKSEAAAKRTAMRDISVAPISAYREAAAQMIEGKAIADIQPTRYLDASRKYSREAFDALRKGDAEEAANAKHKELLNHFLFREATKAKEFVSKFEAFSKKFDRKGVRERIAKAGGVDGQRVYLDQIDGLRGLFGLTEPIADPAQMRQGFTDFANFQQQRAVERFDALNPTWAEDHPGESPDIPQMVDTAILDSAKNYRNLNVAQLRMLNDTLKNVEALAKNDFGAIRDGRRVSFADEVVAFQSQSRGALKEKPVPRSGTDFSTAENIGRTVQGLDAYMQKMEWLIDALDGGDVDGPARRNIKRPIDEANAKSLQMGDEIYKKLGEVIDARPKEDVRDLNELTGVQFPYFDRPLTRKQLISWALNLGTEENQKVALLGEGLINADGSFHPEYDKALKSLRASEWKMVQGVWDTLDGMLPAIREKALRETGIEPKLKAVRSFDVTTESGEVVKLQGGYYPLKGEPGDRVGMLQNEPVASRRPTTSNSHLQTVTGATYRLQMNYDSVLSRHLADVIADTTKGEAVAQVHKFISNDEVRTTLRETLGEKYEPEFMKWLQDFVSEGRGAAQDSSPLLDFMLSRKSGMVAARLGGNLGSYLVQFGDVFKSLADPDVKTKYLAKAFIDIRTSPTETIAQIREMSPNEMRFREKNFNREIRDMLVSKGLFDQKKQAVTEFLMEGFQVMDKLITFPAWLGRYRQGIAEHGDNGRAIREADRAIARGYQSGDNRNMSRMMRQGGWARLFTTFQGDANTWYGILSSSVRSADPKRISVAVMALVMEQIVGQYIRNRGPQEDENKAGWALEQTLIAGVGKVPIMGDVAQYAMSKLTGHYASLQNPTSSTLEKMASSPASVYKFTQGKKDGEEAAQDVMEATGLFLGIPGTSQAIRTWKYVHNINTGKQAAPANAAEAARAAVFGANSKK